MKRIAAAVMVLAMGMAVFAQQSYQDAGSGFKKGFQEITELGFTKGTGAYYLNFFNVNIIGDYRFNPYFSLGVGTGCRYYLTSSNGKQGPSSQWLQASSEDSLSPSVAIPVFIDIRTNFRNAATTPYFSLRLGYSIVVTRNDPIESSWYYSAGPELGEPLKWGLYKGGSFLNPSLGIRFALFGKCVFHAGIGYEMQGITVHLRKLEQQYQFVGSYWGHRLLDMTSHSISFNTGISF
ncbi:MAG: hypothetical protein ABSF80_11705 [Chitinispirillaceae bacterium]|jgi:hypothetical protein